MKKVTKFFMVALLARMCSFGYAQQYEWKKSPKNGEVEIGVITNQYDAGQKVIDIHNICIFDTKREFTEEQLYNILLSIAKQKYGESHPNFVLRNFKSSSGQKTRQDPYYERNKFVGYDNFYDYYYNISATVVIPDPKLEADKKLSQSLDKALRNVRQGSRIAIDQVTVGSGINREDYKDRLIDVLLDKGYKVVAKEYLEKLYEEQQNQQSGIYNERTTVQENNFSAVGYYINVKVTETSLRVQVINVSTGEYEGNATVNF